VNDLKYMGQTSVGWMIMKPLSFDFAAVSILVLSNNSYFNLCEKIIFEFLKTWLYLSKIILMVTTILKNIARCNFWFKFKIIFMYIECILVSHELWLNSVTFNCNIKLKLITSEYMQSLCQRGVAIITMWMNHQVWFPT
jgi:hypothetical protein